MRLNRSGHNRGPRVEVGRHEDSSRGVGGGGEREGKKKNMDPWLCHKHGIV